MTVFASVLDDMVLPTYKITIADQIDVLEVGVHHFDARIDNANEDSFPAQTEVVLECVDVGVLIGPTGIWRECPGEQGCELGVGEL